MKHAIIMQRALPVFQGSQLAYISPKLTKRTMQRNLNPVEDSGFHSF